MTDLEFLYEMRRKVNDAVVHANFTRAQVRRVGDIYPYLYIHAWDWMYLNHGGGYRTSIAEAHTILDAAIDYEEERIANQVAKQLESYP